MLELLGYVDDGRRRELEKELGLCLCKGRFRRSAVTDKRFVAGKAVGLTDEALDIWIKQDSTALIDSLIEFSKSGVDK